MVFSLLLKIDYNPDFGLGGCGLMSLNCHKVGIGGLDRKSTKS